MGFIKGRSFIVGMAVCSVAVSTVGCGAVPGTSLETIPEDSVGLVINLYGNKDEVGAVNGKQIPPGQRVWFNGYTQVVRWLPIRQQQYPFTKNPAEGSSSNEEICFAVEGSEVCVDVAPTFAFRREYVGKFFVTYGLIGSEQFISSQFKNGLRHCLSQEAAKMSVANKDQKSNMLVEIRRNPVKLLDQARSCLSGKFPFTEISALELLGKPRLANKQLEDAIETQLLEVQESLKAQATADKEVAMAKAKTAKAQGDADAARILTSSASYLALERLKIDQIKWNKWNGVLPGAGTNIQSQNTQVPAKAN